MSFNITELLSQFGAYYKPGSDNEKNLRKMLYNKYQTSSYFQNRPTSDTIWRGVLASIDRIVQPFQKAYTPISTTAFMPNTFNLFELKIDLQEYPDTLEASYVGFLDDMEENDRSKWPFVRWWIENLIIPRKNDDMELTECFGGVYAAPTPGTAGAAGTAMNGLKKVIRGYNTAGVTNLGDGAYAMGAPATAPEDFCVQIEEFADSIPSVFRSQIDYIFMNKTLAKRYRKGKAKIYGKDVNFLTGTAVSDKSTIEDEPQISVVGLESHTGSDLIWATIPVNRIRPIKKASQGESLLASQYSPRQVSIYGDWWEALNFEVPDFIFHNDQDLS